MKKIALSFLLISHGINASVPSLDVILAEVSKNCLKAQKLNAIVTRGYEKSFALMKLNDLGLFITEERSIIEGKPKKPIKDKEDLYFLAKLMGCKTSSKVDELKKYLSQIGVNLNMITYGLWMNDIVFIIGAGPTDEHAAQVWVEKNSFLPVKEVSRGRTTIFRWIDKEFPSSISTFEGDEKSSLSISKAPEDK